jgi:hypothetical protein
MFFFLFTTMCVIFVCCMQKQKKCAQWWWKSSQCMFWFAHASEIWNNAVYDIIENPRGHQNFFVWLYRTIEKKKIFFFFFFLCAIAFGNISKIIVKASLRRRSEKSLAFPCDYRCPTMRIFCFSENVAKKHITIMIKNKGVCA